MRIAGKIWRLLVGIKDGLVLLFMLLFFALLYAALSASPYRDSARRGALHLELSGPIVEQPSQPGLTQLVGGSVTRQTRLRDLLHALDKAKDDSSIEAVALDLDLFTGGGQVAIANVADRIDAIRASGKKVVAYSTGYSDSAYLLAAHADEVWLNPLGAVLVTGRGGSSLYYAGLLDRLGITANVYRVGTYKAAVEPFTRSDMSPEAREALQGVLDNLWQAWLEDAQRARPRARIADYAANPLPFIQAAGGDMARAALEAGLIDRIGDKAMFGARMAELVQTDQPRVPGSYRQVKLDAYLAANPIESRRGQVGVLTVAGEIMDGTAGPGLAGAETIVAQLEEGLKSHDLKALVVRVDSPGGSTLASERIRRALRTVRERGIPVVVSFGSVAASGGYWIATASDHIMAEPGTVTGSIGVFGLLPSFEGTLQQLDLGADGVRTTPLAGEPDLLQGPSPMADQLLQTGVESTYRRFLTLVSRARNLPMERVDEIAQGRIWAGGTARQLGLVDQFGSLDDAIAEAARRADLDPEKARTVWLEPQPTFLARLIGGAAQSRAAPAAAADPFAGLAPAPQELVARAAADARLILSGPTIQARCLECPPTGAPPRVEESLSWLGWLKALLRG
jgi:protease IV